MQIVATGVCHTDAFTLSGADPEGLFPVILGHEGGGIVQEIGPGVTSVKPGDHVIPLYTPECGACKFCKSGKTNLCQAIRVTQGKGLMPDGTSRFSKNGKPILHYMGCSTFSEYTVLPEIALAKINPKAPLDKVCLLGCGITTGIGAVLNTAKVHARLDGRGVRPRRHRPCLRAGRGHGESLAHHRGRSQSVEVGNGQGDGRDRLRQSGRLQGHADPAGHRRHDRRRRRLLVRMHRQHKVMRSALECCHKGWGESTIIGVAGAGQEISTRPFQLVTGRVWRGSAFGGVKGRTQLPGYVENYMNGKLKIDEFVTEVLPLDQINHAFDLMHEGKVIRSVIRY